MITIATLTSTITTMSILQRACAGAVLPALAGVVATFSSWWLAGRALLLRSPQVELAFARAIDVVSMQDGTQRADRGPVALSSSALHRA